MSDTNPQDLKPKFLRRDPRDASKLIEVDVSGQPVKKADDKADGQADADADADKNPPATDRRNVEQLKNALTSAGVAIPDGAKREDLLKLVTANNV